MMGEPCSSGALLLHSPGCVFALSQSLKGAVGENYGVKEELLSYGFVRGQCVLNYK
jgi:hypothetical protein